MHHTFVFFSTSSKRTLSVTFPSALRVYSSYRAFHNLQIFLRCRRYGAADFTALPKPGRREVVLPEFVKFLDQYPIVEAHIETVMNERGLWQSNFLSS